MQWPLGFSRGNRILIFLSMIAVFSIIACGGGSADSNDPAKTYQFEILHGSTTFIPGQSLDFGVGPSYPAGTSLQWWINDPKGGVISLYHGGLIAQVRASGYPGDYVLNAKMGDGRTTACAFTVVGATFPDGSCDANFNQAIADGETSFGPETIEDDPSQTSVCVLGNGKSVLFSRGNGSVLDTSSDLDLATSGGWTPTLNTPSSIHEGGTATLITAGSSAGKVLLCGGWDYYHVGVNQAFAELFDPSNGIYSRVADIPEGGRHDATGTLLADGRHVLISGGDDNGTGTSTLVFDGDTLTWSRGPALIANRKYHVAQLLQDGRVFIAGGRLEIDPNAPYNSPPTTLNSSELLTLDTTSVTGGVMSGSSSAGPQLLEAVECLLATTMNDGRVLLAGGRTYTISGSIGTYRTPAIAMVYEPTGGSPGTVSATGSMSGGHLCGSMGKLSDGTPYVIGGGYWLSDYGSVGYQAAMEQYRNGTWTTFGTISIPNASWGIQSVYFPKTASDSERLWIFSSEGPSLDYYF